MKLKELRDEQQRKIGYIFKCPGCNGYHTPRTFRDGVSQVWTFNADMDKPTFSPSLLAKMDDNICHSFVCNGNIRFCADSTHELAGKEVQMLDISEW